MDIRFLSHARDRMTERAISELDVRTALRNYHLSTQTPNNSVMYVGAAPDGRELKVWVLPPGITGDLVTVKSVAWKD